MLYLVLVLVITAFVLLIAALTTANTVWAWVSVGISAVAAGLLVFDWLRSRRRVAAASAPRRAAEPEPDDAEPVPPIVEATTQIPAVERIEEPPPVVEAPKDVAEPAGADEEPGEEPTDATDLLVITDLDVEVRVVDEHPRYHLVQCTWLSGKATIPIAVSEARQLGFTPCARCGPDAVLAARHRAGKIEGYSQPRPSDGGPLGGVRSD